MEYFTLSYCWSSSLVALLILAAVIRAPGQASADTSICNKSKTGYIQIRVIGPYVHDRFMAITTKGNVFIIKSEQQGHSLTIDDIPRTASVLWPSHRADLNFGSNNEKTNKVFYFIMRANQKTLIGQVTQNVQTNTTICVKFYKFDDEGESHKAKCKDLKVKIDVVISSAFTGPGIGFKAEKDKTCAAVEFHYDEQEPIRKVSPFMSCFGTRSQNDAIDSALCGLYIKPEQKLLLFFTDAVWIYSSFDKSTKARHNANKLSKVVRPIQDLIKCSPNLESKRDGQQPNSRSSNGKIYFILLFITAIGLCGSNAYTLYLLIMQWKAPT